MSNTAQRILEAVQGDTDTITKLAGAIARNDAGAVQALLQARGVTVTDDEVGAVVRGATAGDAMACTCTCTCT